DEPQHVQVARAVVDEEAPAVEAIEPVIGELVRPELEGRDVVPEAGAGQEVCDDEPEGEPQGQQDEDAAGVPGPGPRGCPPRVGLTDCGACQIENGLQRAMRCLGA